MLPAEPPITVVAGHPGEQLFAGLRDPRVRLVPAGAAVSPDLVVFPVGSDRPLEHPRTSPLLARLRPQLASGATGLVLDCSTEGVLHSPARTAALHGLLRHLAMPARHCVYVTQERGFAADYQAECAAARLGEPVAVVVHDYWIWRALAPLADEGPRLYEERREAFRARPTRRGRRFISLNRTPRPAKILFLLTLLRDGLWERGYVSFGGFREKGGKPRPSAEALAAKLPGFADRVAELAPLLDRLDGIGRVLLDRGARGGPLKAVDAVVPEALPEYADSWFSVVTETEMRPRPSRITEKMLKPLVNFHPFVVFGNPGALAMVREYGFETFDAIVDEGYDEVDDPRERFERAYGEVVRLCGLPDDAWRAAEARVAEVLDHNARWGLTRVPTDYRAARDRALLDRILSGVGRCQRAD